MSENEKEKVQVLMSSFTYRSQKIGELALALSKAQGEMGAVEEDKENKYSGYRYSSLDAIQKVVRPGLSKYEIAIIQGTEINDLGQEIIFTELIHSSGQWRKTIRLTPEVEFMKGLTPVQVYGLNKTYILKYQLKAMCGVSSGSDDTDGTHSQQTNEQQQSPIQPSTQQQPSSQQQPPPPQQPQPAKPKEWLPIWNEFVTNVAPFLKFQIGDVSEMSLKEKVLNVKAFLPPKGHELFVENWDPAQAVALKHFLIQRDTPTWEYFVEVVSPLLPYQMGDVSELDMAQKAANLKNCLPKPGHKLSLDEEWEPKKAIALKQWLIEQDSQLNEQTNDGEVTIS